MFSEQTEKALFATWQNHMKCNHPFAPQMILMRAELTTGHMASGLAATASESLDRCLGETAEAMALEKAGILADVPSFLCGVACHPDGEVAKDLAFYEAVERRDVLAWWRGDTAALRLSHAWLDKNGVSPLLLSLRQGADTRRETDLWLLDTGPLSTMVARSTSVSGQECILGFGTGADPLSAAIKAVHEAILMEVIIADLQAHRGGNITRDFDYKQDISALHGMGSNLRLPLDPRSDGRPKICADTIENFRATVQFDDLTLLGMPVWMCRTNSHDINVPVFGQHPYINGTDRKVRAQGQLMTPDMWEGKVMKKSTWGGGGEQYQIIRGEGNQAQFGDKDVILGEKHQGTPREQPKNMNFGERYWRHYCMSKRAVIPAGYTYLGQLIGHDAGHSVNLTMIPHSTGDVEDDDKPVVGYNIIENVLTFETLYGSGPLVLHHVFDPFTKLFNVGPNSTISVALSGEFVRGLYDIRNRDTVMLHQIATLWMKYHNKIAFQLDPSLFESRQKPTHRRGANNVYQIARYHVLQTWHRVIRDDFLAKFMHPKVAELTAADMATIKPVNVTTLQNGLFRVFHCLPRSGYRMDGDNAAAGIQPMRHLRANLPKLSDADTQLEPGWRVDLLSFFTGTLADNRAGVSASVTDSLSDLIERDFNSAKNGDAARWGSGSVQGTIEQLRRLKINVEAPETMAQALNNDIVTSGIPTIQGFKITASEIQAAPLYIALMIEAHLYGSNGRLGPLGSVMLRKALEDAIANVTFSKPKNIIAGLEKHRTMQDIINFVEGNADG